MRFDRESYYGDSSDVASRIATYDSNQQRQLTNPSSSRQCWISTSDDDSIFNVLSINSLSNVEINISFSDFNSEDWASQSGLYSSLRNNDAEIIADFQSKSDHSPLEQHSTLKQNQQNPKPKKIKKDQGKNIPQSVLNMVIKAILSKNFQKRLKKIRQKIIMKMRKIKKLADLSQFKEIDLDQFEKIIESNQYGSYYLQDVLRMVDYKSCEGKEKFWKMMFHHFYLWYLRRYASVNILQSDQCEHKQLYMKTIKTYLYIGDDRKEKSSRRRVQTEEKLIKPLIIQQANI